jgi:hypothetical protein
MAKVPENAAGWSKLTTLIIIFRESWYFSIAALESMEFNMTYYISLSPPSQLAPEHYVNILGR